MTTETKPIDDALYHGIANKFLEFIKENLPKNMACMMAFSNDGERIGVIIGGQDSNSTTFDQMLTKLGSNIDQRRDFSVDSSIHRIERQEH